MTTALKLHVNKRAAINTTQESYSVKFILHQVSNKLNGNNDKLKYEMPNKSLKPIAAPGARLRLSSSLGKSIFEEAACEFLSLYLPFWHYPVAQQIHALEFGGHNTELMKPQRKAAMVCQTRKRLQIKIETDPELEKN